MPVATLCELRGIEITDVFRVRTFIRPAGRGADEDWQRWSMYNLTRTGQGGQSGNRPFVPPAIRAGIGVLVTPRGMILRHGLDLPEPQPHFIHEEEIACVGTAVTGTFQRTSWWDV